MKYAASLTLSFLCILACEQALATKGKIYKWVDDQGVTHYSANPELNKPAEIIKPKTGHSDPVTYTTPTAPVTKAEATAKQASQKDPERCEAARKNQTTLKTFSRIKTKGDDGEYYYLTPEEQKQRLDEAEQTVAESCE
jgi:hypothetical protein